MPAADADRADDHAQVLWLPGRRRARPRAELSLVIETPAVHATPGVPRAGVVLAAIDLDHARQIDRDGAATPWRRAAELTAVVVAPAGERATGEHGAGVLVAEPDGVH